MSTPRLGALTLNGGPASTLGPLVLTLDLSTPASDLASGEGRISHALLCLCHSFRRSQPLWGPPPRLLVFDYHLAGFFTDPSQVDAGCLWAWQTFQVRVRSLATYSKEAWQPSATLLASLTPSPRPGMSPESLPSFWDIGVFCHSLSCQHHVNVNVVSMTNITGEGRPATGHPVCCVPLP